MSDDRATPRKCPKFWDETKKRVVEGVEIRKTPTKLADMLGTYAWVFSGDPEYPGEVEKLSRRDYPDDSDAAFIAKYSIMLDAGAKHTPGEPVAPADVSGYVAWCYVKMTFEGVRSVREGWPESSDPDAPITESYWEVLMTEEQDDEEAYFWLDWAGNAVGAAVVLDDNGFPFLVFDWHHPPADHGSWSGYYVGKRLVEGKDWRLTDEERVRLGIGATFRSVEQLVKEGTPGVYSEDSEEDSEEEKVGGSSEKKAVGKKRKANTDGTGAKKRKANTEETGAKKMKTEEAGSKTGKASTDETGAKKKRRRRRRRRAQISWLVMVLLLLLSAEHLYSDKCFSTSSRPVFQEQLSKKSSNSMSIICASFRIAEFNTIYIQ
ncbi:hypothetical protein F5887DRAFT_1077007 [Amanita rubescens]|nr:hypothetical protein F5887DRAFT_1077007 [Amanita rubescens]